jgi:hypothetical protein
MDHADALERIELAAAEPEGIDRLMAGDTPDAALVAGHLAGCPSCMVSLAAIRRSAALVAEAIREAPDPALRERTLEFVRAVGRPREQRRSGTVEASVVGAPLAEPPADVSEAAVPAAARRGFAAPISWAASLVAVAILAATVTFAAVGLDRDQQLAGQADDLAALARTTALSMKVEAEPDGAKVLLTAGDGSADGVVLFAPASGDVVVMVNGLPPAPEGSVWLAWWERDGGRQPIGPLRHAGDLAAWAGSVDGMRSTGKPTRFGVSLVASASWTPAASPLLEGEP